ncbi:MAG: 1,4-dihydroxy-2-naphthoate polyprenyltransferase [Acidimicrobiia bacterium]|nr:1,4-dihydroxy-2-naphthoate polyprenyltransferase [Acidimicrobiia bacterium]
MNVWVEAARPRTLPAAVAPVLVGTAAATRFVAWRFAGALVVAVAVQVAVNYANDYFDGVRGLDTPQRVGPRRAVATGLVAPARMRTGVGVALGVAAVAGLALSAAVGWELLLVGLACFAACLAYSGGPRPYASAGLGELFVFVFFGLVATVGSAYVHDERVVAVAVAASVPVGMLATAILVANNLRDIPTDAAGGKATMAVRLGDRLTRVFYLVLVAGAFLVAAASLPVMTGSLWPLLTVAAVPLSVRPLRAVASDATGRELVPALAGTGVLELAFAVLLGVGLVLA